MASPSVAHAIFTHAWDLCSCRSFGGAAGQGDDAETDAESEEESEEDMSSTDSSSSAYSSDLDERLLGLDDVQSVASTSESANSEPALWHASSSKDLHMQLLNGQPCSLRRTQSLCGQMVRPGCTTSPMSSW